MYETTPKSSKRMESAFNAFCSIRRAEGISKTTLEGYGTIIIPFLREHPDFLESPRETILEFISAPVNQWSKFTRTKILKVFCNFLIDEGILEKSPLKGIKTIVPDVKAHCPQMEDVKSFIKQLDTSKFADLRLKTIILLAIDTGLRRGELCGLKLTDFDIENMVIRVRGETSKSKRDRLVPISPQIAKEVRRFSVVCAKKWDTEWLFPTETGGYMRPENLGLQIRRMSDKTGIKLKLHGLRHLCATEFLRNTGNLALTARLLGHTNVTVTSKYYEHLNLEDLRKAHGQASVISGVLNNKRARNSR